MTIHCAIEGCDKTLKGHAWSKIKSDWFFLKDGTAYCSEHIPEWVNKWRRKRR